MPGQSLLAQLGQEGIRVELLDIEDTGAAPEALGPHRGAQSGRDTRRERHGLRAGLLVGLLVVAVVVDIVGVLLAVLHTADAAADRGLPVRAAAP